MTRKETDLAMIDTTGLDKRDVLCALYNASRPQGMGFLQYESKPMDRKEAEELLAHGTAFDYLKGRVMKISLSRDEGFDERLYDRDNGEGAAERVVSPLRVGKPADCDEIRTQHQENVQQATALTNNYLRQETRASPDGSVVLGLADVADLLKPAIKSAKANNLRR